MDQQPRVTKPANFIIFIASVIVLSAVAVGTFQIASRLNGTSLTVAVAVGAGIFLALSVLVFLLVSRNAIQAHGAIAGNERLLTIIRRETESIRIFLNAIDKIRASENQTVLNEHYASLEAKFAQLTGTLAEYEKNAVSQRGRKTNDRITVLGMDIQNLKRELAVIIEQFAAEYLKNKNLVNATYNNMGSLIYHLAVAMPILMDFTNIFNSFSKDMILDVISKFGEITSSSHRMADEIESSINSLMDETKQDSLSFIIRKAHDLVMDFENFYKNMDNLKEVSDTFTEKSAEKLRNIQDIANSIEEIAETIKVLSLNVSIEAANTGAAGKGFQVLARDLRDFTNRTMKFAHDVKNRVKDALSTTENLKSNYVQSMNVVYRYMDEIKSSIKSFEGIIHTSFEKLKSIIDNLRKFSTSIDAGIKEVVSKLQYYDITSQEVDHLRLFFEKLFINIYNTKSIHIDVGNIIPDQEKTEIKKEILKIIGEIITTSNERKILGKYEDSFGIRSENSQTHRNSAIQKILQEDNVILF